MKPEEVFEELIANQEKKLLNFARKIIPTATRDDVLQPNDYPDLENHPLFRYEEGVLEGLMTARMAFLANQKDQTCS